MKKETKIDWKEVDKESELCLQKCFNFEKDLKRIKQSKKSLEKTTQEVNDFCKENNLQTHILKLKK